MPNHRLGMARWLASDAGIPYELHDAVDLSEFEQNAAEIEERLKLWKEF